MSRYGIIFNVDRCIGCEACFVACKEENKVAPGIQWNKIRRSRMSESASSTTIASRASTARIPHA